MSRTRHPRPPKTTCVHAAELAQLRARVATLTAALKTCTECHDIDCPYATNQSEDLAPIINAAGDRCYACTALAALDAPK